MARQRKKVNKKFGSLAPIQFLLILCRAMMTRVVSNFLSVWPVCLACSYYPDTCILKWMVDQTLNR